MRPRLTRRRVLGCCVGGAAALTLDAVVLEPRWLDVARYDVAVPNLPRASDGLRIAHVSDLHLDAVRGIHASIAGELRRFSPQLTFVSGDTVESEGALPVLEELTALLVAATTGQVVATSGNWEHWGHVERGKLARAYERAGALLMTNEAATMEGLRLLAIDDFCSGHAQPLAPLRDAGPAESPRVVVTHAPGLFEDLPASFPSFALALAGHTHGGQLCAAGLPVWTPPGSGSFVEGRYDTTRGPLLVSRGVGMSVLGARLTCRPEISLITLHRS